jgi:acyl-coenzyme A thioesterase PaaI-like protein
MASGSAGVGDVDRFEIVPRAAGLGLCDGCAARGHCRLGLTGAEREGATLRVHLSCAPEHRGSPVAAHGGWIASVFDDALATAVLRENPRIVTRSLSVTYLAPVPLERPLVVEATVAGHDGRDWAVTGVLRLAETGRALARASASFVARSEHYYGTMQDRLAREAATVDDGRAR